MENKYAVKFNNVSKIYSIKSKDSEDRLIKQKFYALKDISFEIPKGEIVGILGTNGSGKSTLSKILAGISEIDSGSVDIEGEASLIAIRSGLNNQLTGYENIELKGAMIGLSKEKIESSAKAIIEFSELGDFIHQPVKTYSSGMKSKLGFAISINMEPDIIIVDEALSVGDTSFSDKCYEKIKELQDKGRTIFFVSHSIQELRKFCNSGIWIEGGNLEYSGSIEDTIKKYEAFVSDYKKKTKQEQNKIRNDKFNNRILSSKEISKSKLSKKRWKKLSKALLMLIGLLAYGIGALYLYKILN